jgi:hypothetical protein
MPRGAPLDKSRLLEDSQDRVLNTEIRADLLDRVGDFNLLVSIGSRNCGSRVVTADLNITACSASDCPAHQSESLLSDVAIAKYWLNVCEKCHNFCNSRAPQCKTGNAAEAPLPTRVIDVHEWISMCIQRHDSLHHVELVDAMPRSATFGEKDITSRLRYRI